ncbi:hypothetical protein [Streptomyces syringium]|uniref:hypothetical protein n=1 Tax=Streptomyces syringium TaxID=76729 RepID=UPI003AAE05F6
MPVQRWPSPNFQSTFAASSSSMVTSPSLRASGLEPTLVRKVSKPSRVVVNWRYSELDFQALVSKWATFSE